MNRFFLCVVFILSVFGSKHGLADQVDAADAKQVNELFVSCLEDTGIDSCEKILALEKLRLSCKNRMPGDAVLGCSDRGKDVEHITVDPQILSAAQQKVDEFHNEKALLAEQQLAREEERRRLQIEEEKQKEIRRRQMLAEEQERKRLRQVAESNQRALKECLNFGSEDLSWLAPKERLEALSHIKRGCQSSKKLVSDAESLAVIDKSIRSLQALREKAAREYQIAVEKQEAKEKATRETGQSGGQRGSDPRATALNLQREDTEFIEKLLKMVEQDSSRRQYAIEASRQRAAKIKRPTADDIPLLALFGILKDGGDLQSSLENTVGLADRMFMKGQRLNRLRKYSGLFR